MVGVAIVGWWPQRIHPIPNVWLLDGLLPQEIWISNAKEVQKSMPYVPQKSIWCDFYVVADWCWLYIPCLFPLRNYFIIYSYNDNIHPLKDKISQHNYINTIELVPKPTSPLQAYVPRTWEACHEQVSSGCHPGLHRISRRWTWTLGRPWKLCKPWLPSGDQTWQAARNPSAPHVL